MRRIFAALLMLFAFPIAGWSQPATVVLTFDYYASAYNDAFAILNPLNLPATWFVEPATVGQNGAPTLGSMVLLEQVGWEIGIYSGQNMVTALSNNRVTAKQWIASQKAAMLALGFNSKSYAPNQRAWSGSLANITRYNFDAVRVAASSPWQTYPIADKAYVDNGGTASLSSSDTGASLCSTLSTVIAAGPVAWFVVIHKVGSVPDAYTVATPDFTTFANCLATARNAGQIRVVRFSDAMNPP